MSRKRLVEDMNIDSEWLDYSKWPTVHIDHRNEVFDKRKRAVELYLNNELDINEISRITGINRRDLPELIRKCLKKDTSGLIWGFRALLPYRRTGATYERSKPVDGFSKQLSFTGAFRQLLSKYPSVDDLIKNYILRRRKRAAADKIIRVKDLRKKFLDLCRAEGIELNQYPFNTLDKGLRSLHRYVEKLINENPSKAGARFGEEADLKLNRIDGSSNEKDQIIIPFQRTQFDGHKIDALLTITFTNAFGDEVTELMRRIWLLVHMDVATRAVLSHHLCVKAEYAKSDVLHCYRKSVIPHERMEFSIPGFSYPEKPCFHSDIPEAQWALWDEVLFDNAKPHLSGIVKDRLTEVVNCSVNPGPVAFPEVRGILERFFGVLTQRHIHRLGITTGSNPNDPRRIEPEKTAKKFNATAEELEELIEVCIAEYNTTEHPVLGISPMEAMVQRVKYRGMEPRVLAEEKRADLQFFTYKTTRIIRGSKTTGKRPYINFEGTEYTSALLAKNYSLVNAQVIVEVDIEDISVLKLFLSDGTELDFVRAKGPWGKRPHSLRTRQVINKLTREGKLRYDSHESPVDALERYWEEKSEKTKSARNKLADLRRYKVPVRISEPEIDADDLRTQTSQEFDPPSVSTKSKIDLRNKLRINY